tara:strand:- start:11276 stop:11947 length:672 start_codon:yes stop_codon:yes gene_type:complete
MSTVNLSQQTREILKNFCTINSSILIREGTVLKTISVGENSIAEYNSEETFPQTFGIYDLNQFLGGLSLFDDATLEFGNPNYVTIRGNGRSAKYYFSDPEITLNASPERAIIFPDPDFSFNLKHMDLIALQKASAVYGLPDLLYKASSDGAITLDLCDRENDTGNVYSQTLQGESIGDFEMYMKVENIRVLPGNYTVQVSDQMITKWKNQSIDLTYYVALEPR